MTYQRAASQSSQSRCIYLQSVLAMGMYKICCEDLFCCMSLFCNTINHPAGNSQLLSKLCNAALTSQWSLWIMPENSCHAQKISTWTLDMRHDLQYIKSKTVRNSHQLRPGAQELCQGNPAFQARESWSPAFDDDGAQWSSSAEGPLAWMYRLLERNVFHCQSAADQVLMIRLWGKGVPLSYRACLSVTALSRRGKGPSSSGSSSCNVCTPILSAAFKKFARLGPVYLQK